MKGKQAKGQRDRRGDGRRLGVLGYDQPLSCRLTNIPKPGPLGQTRLTPLVQWLGTESRGLPERHAAAVYRVGNIHASGCLYTGAPASVPD